MMGANAILLIGSVCFLVIYQTKEPGYFRVYIFNTGFFAFCRLMVICFAGNLVINAYRKLVLRIYEKIFEWNINLWISFLEIKQLESQFAVNIGDTYTISHSAILTVLSFVLNYIVVLLQTETYTHNDNHYYSNFRSPTINNTPSNDTQSRV